LVPIPSPRNAIVQLVLYTVGKRILTMKWWDSQQTTEDLFVYTEHTQEKVTDAVV
jgi:hypothetical protein